VKHFPTSVLERGEGRGGGRRKGEGGGGQGQHGLQNPRTPTAKIYPDDDLSKISAGKGDGGGNGKWASIDEPTKHTRDPRGGGGPGQHGLLNPRTLTAKNSTDDLSRIFGGRGMDTASGLGTASPQSSPVTQGSMACSTSAPVRPMIMPTMSCCSSTLKFSANNGHSSCSSPVTCSNRVARIAAHMRCSLAAWVRSSTRSVLPRILLNTCADRTDLSA